MNYTTPETKSPEPEKKVELDPEKANAIIKDYILDDVIEESYQHKTLSVTLRVPTQGQLMQSAADVDEEVFTAGDNISMDRMNMIRNNSIVSLYLKKFGKRDFLAEQGDAYYTAEGYKDRKKFIMEDPSISVYVMEWLLSKLSEFQTLVTDAFKEPSLKNM